MRHWKVISFALFFVSLMTFAAFTGEVSGQTRRRRAVDEAAEADSIWYWAALIVLVAALGFAVVWWRKKSALKAENSSTPRLQSRTANQSTAENEGDTLEKYPMETFRPSETAAISANLRHTEGNSGMIIFQLKRLNPARQFEPLPISLDDTLLEAIEQIQSEDEDEEFRALAVRVLTAFRTQNAVDALAQVAHYDLSPNLRVNAVQSLAEFNHESVFEPILLACADPAREVKAAAARSIARLSIDRADAFTRIVENPDRQNLHIAAHACIESGFAERAFERLTHNDPKQVYEAFAIIALLFKAEQDEIVMRHLETNQNPNIRLAIVHILSILRPRHLSQKIYEIGSRGNQVHKVQDALNKLNEDFAMA